MSIAFTLLLEITRYSSLTSPFVIQTLRRWHIKHAVGDSALLETAHVILILIKLQFYLTSLLLAFWTSRFCYLYTTTVHCINQGYCTLHSSSILNKDIKQGHIITSCYIDFNMLCCIRYGNCILCCCNPSMSLKVKCERKRRIS